MPGRPSITLGAVTDQYFSDSDPAPASEQRLLHVTARGHDLQMRVSDRVFSGGRVDLGTRQLLAEAPALPASGTFLDLGCGWGPLAVVMGLESPGAQVWAVDVNSRAIDLTHRNARTNGAVNVEVADAGEALGRARDEGVRFDVIWSNPPVRIGKDALHRMLADWLSLLAPDGVVYLVVQRNLGADSLAGWLEDAGFPTARIASKKGYRILETRSLS